MHPAWGLLFTALKRAISRWLYQSRKIRPFFERNNITECQTVILESQSKEPRSCKHDYYTFKYAISMLSTSSCLSATALQQSPRVTFKDAALISTSKKAD